MSRLLSEAWAAGCLSTKRADGAADGAGPLTGL
jgi:hypothetical protein